MFQVFPPEPLANTRAFVFVAEAWYETVLTGFTPDHIGHPPFDHRSWVLYARGPDGDIIGALIWSPDGEDAVRLDLLYVEETSRKLGAARLLLEDFGWQMRERGVRVVRATLPFDHPIRPKVESGLPWKTKTPRLLLTVIP